MGNQRLRLTGRNLTFLLTVGVCCLTVISVVASITGTDGMLQAGVISGIAGALAFGAGKFPLKGG